MKGRLCFKKISGLTLVELIITMAILSLVLMLGFSIFIFGQKTFSGGTKQYDLQSNIRLSDYYIMKEIRYAPVVKIMDTAKMNSHISANGGILPYENFIYYDTTQKYIVHKNVFFTKPLSVGKSGDILFTSTSTVTSPSNELYYKISGQDDSKNFDVENKINCLNVHLSTDKRITFDISVSGSSGNVLYFKSNEDFLAEELKPLASIDSLFDNDSDEFHMTFIKNIISYSITSPTGLNSSNISFTNPSKKFGFTGINGNTDNTILFSLTFEDNLQFDYLAVYNSTTGIWSVK